MYIKVGLLFSLTGTTSITEKGQSDAAKFAISEYQSDHYTIEAIVRDICSDPVKGAEEAEKLAKEGVRIFIGCYTSACRKAILPVLEKYNCLLVYPALYEGRECHPNVLYTGEVPNQQVHTLLDYMVHHYGKKVFCIGSDYIYPRETNQQVKTYLQEMNGSVIGEHYVPLGQQNFYDVLQEIILKKPDAIVSTIVGKSVISFYQEYHRLGLSPDKMPIFSPITKETEIDVMGAKVAQGHYGSASYFQSIKNEQNLHFVKNFRQFTKGNKGISSVMFNTYLGTKLIIDSIIETKSIEHRTIFYHLSDKKIESPCGTLVFDSTHRHLSRPAKIGKVLSDGQFGIVWDSEHNISPKPFKEKGRRYEHLNEVFLRAWGEVCEQALFVLSNELKILYISEKGAQLTKYKEGQFISKSMLQQLDTTFQVHHYETNNQQLYLIKPKKNIHRSGTIFKFGQIRTLSDQFRTELEVAKIASQSVANVLILGETGTGKEVIAKSIHYQSDRKNGPFIPVNTGMLPKELITSELFGFVEGAFTGAKKGGSIGKFEAANYGTIFLDEIGDMPYELQVVLLRAIETKKIVRLGDTKERPVDVRIIAATNRNLDEEIAYNNSFRSDLFYRLNVLSISIPPLRNRIEDMEFLCEEILQEFQEIYGSGPNKMSDEAFSSLFQYHWPGNIRELRNVLERAFLLGRAEESHIKAKHLPTALKGYYQLKKPKEKSLKDLEKTMIEQTLQESKSVMEASQVLGISRSTLYRKIKEFHITV
ncbi:transporter substrate-binding protein [Bacillus sp. REN16]|uniref:transporter substrate-binding protein n=1 Tax=Bacillus sp. REN16 TaxID=2887296 RepID=UPI001E3D98B6|nr:transporter substrate-binding protein [Bacillus sp. REN16]MCC3358208.1 transporter substrate-binding protein [Bacillus sp. REN16]